MRIGIVGMGWVGTSVAISTLHKGLATELLLHDVRGAVAEGEAMDLSQGAAFYPSCRVRAVGLTEMRDLDAVVVAAGRGGAPGESRLELLKDNIRIARSIGKELRGMSGLLVVVSNPVDVLTRVFAEEMDLPLSRVLGTGTMLDTARLREAIGRELKLDARSVHALVVGEHGDSEVCLWSSARVGGTTLRRFPGWRDSRETEIATEVRRAAYEIIRRKGATNHAIGLVTAALLRWSLRGGRRILTVSRVQPPELGFGPVALSLPTVVGPQGAEQVVLPELTDEERSGLEKSASVLDEALRSATAATD